MTIFGDFEVYYNSVCIVLSQIFLPYWYKWYYGPKQLLEYCDMYCLTLSAPALASMPTNWQFIFSSDLIVQISKNEINLCF